MTDQSELQDFLRSTDVEVREFLLSSATLKHFGPPDFRDSSILSYIRRPAKRLRPAVLLLACGAVGGDPRRARSAAAGVEVFHTWTLVHDDLIDNDDLRRGAATVHAAAASRFVERRGERGRAGEYGRDVAVLAGDAQHGWSVVLFLESARSLGVDPRVAIEIVTQLQSSVLGQLIHGELLDVEFAMFGGAALPSLDQSQVVEMLRLKTGVLYEFAGMAGAMIGLDCPDPAHPQVDGLRRFAGDCGIAFQLLDDILGVVGDQEMLGKPVGSDIREGKKTVIVLEALRNASTDERQRLLSVLGKREASSDEIAGAVELLRRLGGIEYTYKLAEQYIAGALKHLDSLKESRFTRLLRAWADYVVSRKV